MLLINIYQKWKFFLFLDLIKLSTWKYFCNENVAARKSNRKVVLNFIRQKCIHFSSMKSHWIFVFELPFHIKCDFEKCQSMMQTYLNIECNECRDAVVFDEKQFICKGKHLKSNQIKMDLVNLSLNRFENEQLNFWESFKLIWLNSLHIKSIVVPTQQNIVASNSSLNYVQI